MKARSSSSKGMLVEHVVHIAIFSLVSTWAMAPLISTIRVRVQQQDEVASVALAIIPRALLLLLCLYMIKNELQLLVQRLRGQLPPGYIGFPIVRDVFTIYQFMTSGFGGLQDACQQYGSIFTTCLFGQVRILLGGHDDLAWIFHSDRKALTQVSWPPNIQLLLGPGAVANQSGKYHRTLRRLLEPYFSPKFVNAHYYRVMDDTTMEELERWCAATTEEAGDYVSSEVFKMYALRLFYVSSFGTVDETLILELHDQFKIWLNGFISPITASFPGNPFTAAMKARERILEIVDTLIDDFQRDNPEDSERAKTTIIGRLIYGKDDDGIGRMMSRDEMKDNLLNLIFAGHDTTYASISTLLYHLSQHPHTMDAITKEVSSFNEPITAEDLKPDNAPVLNACMHEAWRVDPPVPGSFRKAVKDLDTYKGFNFQRGAVFNYSIIAAVTDESLYTKPTEFHFERFLPTDHPLYKPKSSVAATGTTAPIDPLQGRSSYPIFGGGTHVCLGKAFAQLELRILTARMMKYYRVQVRNPKKVYFPVNGWNIEFKLTKRTKAE